MAGNRTELVLSMIAEAISDVEQGVERSCRNIQDSLTMRNADLSSRWERTHQDAAVKATAAARDGGINLDFLRKSTSPLLDEYNSYKKLYAKAVALNIDAHYGYACMSLYKILQSFRRALVDTRGLEGDSSNFFRPHSLGGVEPPEASAVIEAIKRKFNSLNMMDRLDMHTITMALEAINNERELFNRENAINNAFEAAFVGEGDEAGVADVVVLTYLPSEQDKNYPATQQQLSEAITKRPAERGVDWRPDGGAFPYENIWGDNNVGVKALSIILTDAVVPNIFSATFVPYTCNHMRVVIRSVKAILYNDGDDTGGYFEDNRSFCSWIDLYNKLEWFMLVSRFVCFLFSKKDEFLNVGVGGEDNCDGNSVQRLLAAAVESLPPNLLSETWVMRNLLTWNPTVALTPTLTVTEENLLRLAIRTGPSATHPVLGFVNEGNTTLTNRISSRTASFCVQILLGRALDEEKSGVKMLVAAPPLTAETAPGDKTEAGISNGKLSSQRTGNVVGLLPAETVLTRNYQSSPPASEKTAVTSGADSKQETVCRISNSETPFIRNPTYLCKKIWDLENGVGSSGEGVSKVKRETNTIAACLLQHLSPMTFMSSAPGSSAEKAWMGLKLLPCCKAPEMIRNLWTAVNQHPYNDDELVAKLKVISERQCAHARNISQRKKDASLHLSSVIRDSLMDIQRGNKTCSVATEHALWTTAVWKKATQASMMLLSTFPDQRVSTAPGGAPGGL